MLPVVDKRVITLCGCVVLFGFGTTATVDVRPTLTAEIREHRLLAAFSLNTTDTDDLRPALSRCDPVKVVYTVTLAKPVYLWFDVPVGKALVQTGAQCDGDDPGVFHVQRRVNGVMVQKTLMSDVSAVTKFLTDFEMLPLFIDASLRKTETYVIRVRAALQRGKSHTKIGALHEQRIRRFGNATMDYQLVALIGMMVAAIAAGVKLKFWSWPARPGHEYQRVFSTAAAGLLFLVAGLVGWDLSYSHGWFQGTRWVETCNRSAVSPPFGSSALA